MNFYERYIEMCNEKGKAPSSVAMEIGLSKPSVHRWKKGGFPTDATLAKVASYFGVSVAYLLGKEEKNPTTETDSGISKAKADFIQKVMQMSDDQLEQLERILDIVESKGK